MPWFSSPSPSSSRTPPDSSLALEFADAPLDIAEVPPTADVADMPPTAPIDTLVDAATPEAPPKPKIRSIEDLRRLNRRATQEGMYAGVLGGGVLTFIAKRVGMSKNGLVLTFILSGTGISFLTTRTIITSSLGEHYSQLKAAHQPTAPGGGPLLTDETAVGDTQPLPDRPLDPRAQLTRDLNGIGAPRERTRWTKGRGLDGEVEEEAELRDTYLRPGVPRNV